MDWGHLNSFDFDFAVRGTFLLKRKNKTFWPIIEQFKSIIYL